MGFPSSIDLSDGEISLTNTEFATCQDCGLVIRRGLAICSWGCLVWLWHECFVSPFAAWGCVGGMAFSLVCFFSVHHLPFT